MYKDAVLYRNIYLAPGSKAFELYHSKKPEDKKKLDQLLREVDSNEKALLDRYSK